jgi:phage gp45-like
MPKILEQSNNNTPNDKTTSNNDEQRKVRFLIGNEVMDHTDQSEASGVSDSENINYLNNLGDNQNNNEFGGKGHKLTENEDKIDG